MHLLGKVVLVVAQWALEKVPRRLGKLGHAAPMEPAILTARGTNRFQLPVRSDLIVANPTGLGIGVLHLVLQCYVLITPRLERIDVMRQAPIPHPTDRMECTKALLRTARNISIPFLADEALLSSDTSFLIPDVLLHEAEDSLLVFPVLDQIRCQQLKYISPLVSNSQPNQCRQTYQTVIVHPNAPLFVELPQKKLIILGTLANEATRRRR